MGHLGTPELAALALAGTLLTGAFTIFNFLTYGTTAQVARYHGAGREREAGTLGAQALWLSLGIGIALFVFALLFARPAVELMGGEGRTADLAVTYLRIAAAGLPFALIALAGQGFLRGVSDLRTPLVIVVAANVANVVLEVVFVYVFDWGLVGSAWGTVIAQAGMGLAFAHRLLAWSATTRRPSRALIQPLVRVGRHIFMRTTSLYASFLVATAVAARIGDASLGAHLIAFQLFVFIALILDAIAIAGQVIVGRSLGAGHANTAREAGRRMIGWSVAAGVGFALLLTALAGVLPEAFTDDVAVIARAEAVWPLFVFMQPIAGAVFALDGILIGAGDTRYLMWSMAFAALCVYAPIALAALAFDWGLVGVWCGLLALMAARLATLGVRFAGRAWVVTGAPA